MDMNIVTAYGIQFAYGEVPKNAEPTGFGDEVWYHDKEGNIRHSPPRTKMSHPYSYDAIVLFNTGKPTNGSAYSDRMQEWDYEKFNKHLGTGEIKFRWGSQSSVETFARLYFDDVTLKVTKVVEICNVATGYPVGLICWHSDKNKTETVQG